MISGKCNFPRSKGHRDLNFVSLHSFIDARYSSDYFSDNQRFPNLHNLEMAVKMGNVIYKNDYFATITDQVRCSSFVDSIQFQNQQQTLLPSVQKEICHIQMEVMEDTNKAMPRTIVERKCQRSCTGLSCGILFQIRISWERSIKFILVAPLIATGNSCNLHKSNMAAIIQSDIHLGNEGCERSK